MSYATETTLDRYETILLGRLAEANNIALDEVRYAMSVARAAVTVAQVSSYLSLLPIEAGDEDNEEPSEAPQPEPIVINPEPVAPNPDQFPISASTDFNVEAAVSVFTGKIANQIARWILSQPTGTEFTIQDIAADTGLNRGSYRCFYGVRDKMVAHGWITPLGRYKTTSGMGSPPEHWRINI